MHRFPFEHAFGKDRRVMNSVPLQTKCKEARQGRKLRARHNISFKPYSNLFTREHEVLGVHRLLRLGSLVVDVMSTLLLNVLRAG